ncbi:bacteriohemerythrin [Thermocrinis sp.]
MVLRKEDLPMVANVIMNALHEDEVELINELYQVCQEGNVDAVDQLLQLLVQDVEDHFTTEEELMREAEFFAYPMHKAEHDSMRKRIGELLERWRKSRELKEVQKFIQEELVPWLLLHIARWDATTALHLGD